MRSFSTYNLCFCIRHILFYILCVFVVIISCSKPNSSKNSEVKKINEKKHSDNLTPLSGESELDKTYPSKTDKQNFQNDLERKVFAKIDTTISDRCPDLKFDKTYSDYLKTSLLGSDSVVFDKHGWVGEDFHFKGWVNHKLYNGINQYLEQELSFWKPKKPVVCSDFTHYYIVVIYKATNTMGIEDKMLDIFYNWMKK